MSAWKLGRTPKIFPFRTRLALWLAFVLSQSITIAAVGQGAKAIPSNPANPLHPDTSLNRRTAEEMLPRGWTSIDVGTPFVAGSASAKNGLYTVSGSGIGIAGHADQFHFAYIPMAGNGEIAARVVSQTSKVPQAKVGIALREAHGASSAFVMMFLSPGGDVHFRYRDHAGDVPSEVLIKGHSNWLKVGRDGDIFTGYVSSDGAAWTAVANAKVGMPIDLLAGLASTSRDNQTLNSGIFDHVVVTQSDAAWDGVAVALPGTVQAENFNTGGIGWSYSSDFAKDSKGTYRTQESVPVDAIPSSTDGEPREYFLSHLRPNRWLNYSVQIVAEGTYVFSVKAASVGPGGAIHFNLDQAPVTKPIHIPDTGAWQAWQSVTSNPVHLPAGHHVIALVVDSAAQESGAGNIDLFSIQAQ